LPLALSTSEQTAPIPHIAELDGMRGIASLLVFCHHLTNFDGSGGQAPALLLLSRIFVYGRYGVDIFFVLSGFLITSIIFQKRGQRSFYRGFYARRVLRILPLYLLILGLILAVVPHSSGFVVLAALFMANLPAASQFAITTPFWTLAVEEQFYLLWPVAVRRLSLRLVERAALALVGVCLLLRFAFALKGHHNYQLTFLHCDGLALGALLACRFRKRQREGTHERLDDRLLRALSGGGMALMIFGGFLPSTMPWLPFADDLTLTGVTLLSCGVIGLLIAHRGASATGWLRSPGLRFLGLISYGFYLVHVFIMQSYDTLAGPLRAFDAAGIAVRFTVVLAVSFAVSVLLRYTVELPALSLRHRLAPAFAQETEPRGTLAKA
jgi:peptidoglycan/LPS O-acetylase OafA/YrhL